MIKSTISEIVLEMINFVRVMRNELRHHGQAAGCVNRHAHCCWVVAYLRNASRRVVALSGIC
jgi:hypothetical protein